MMRREYQSIFASDTIDGYICGLEEILYPCVVVQEYDYRCHFKTQWLHLGHHVPFPTMHSWPAQEVRLAKRHTLLPQDIVGGGNVEEEVGDAPVGNVNRSTELELPARHLHSNLKLLLALESIFLALGITEQLEGSLDAVLQLCSGGLIIFHDNPLSAGDAMKHALGNVAGELDLEGQRKHVLRKSSLSEVLEGNIVFIRPRFSLLNVVRELSKTADEERDA
jgi:hypothetical protein